MRAFLYLLSALLLAGPGPLGPRGLGQADPRAGARDRGYTADTVIRRLEDNREKIRGLEAQVTREFLPPAETENREEIKVYYRAPDRLRTEISGAKPRTVVINSELMWIYHPRMEMVEQFRLPDENRRLQAMYEMSWGLTSPIMVLVRGMNRSLEELPSGLLLVHLTPDNPEVGLERITALVDPETWLVRSMDIFSPGVPAVRIGVVSWNPETEPGEELFRLELPEGWDFFEEIGADRAPQVQL